MSSPLELLHVHRRTGRGTSSSRAAGSRYLLLVVGMSLVLLALGLALHGPVGG